MRINASNAREASKQILRVIITSDFHNSGYRSNHYGYIFIYFNPEEAKFKFEHSQRKDPAFLVKRYKVLDIEDIIEIVSCKYTFSQIASGAVLSRKMFSPIEYFKIIKSHFDWA